MQEDDSDDKHEENEGSFSYVDLKYHFLKDYEEFKQDKKGSKKEALKDSILTLLKLNKLKTTIWNNRR